MKGRLTLLLEGHPKQSSRFLCISYCPAMRHASCRALVLDAGYISKADLAALQERL